MIEYVNLDLPSLTEEESRRLQNELDLLVDSINSNLKGV